MRSLRTLLTTSILLLLLPTVAAQRSTAESHVVRPGETLGLIAQFYGVDIYKLAAENGIGNAHLIHSWQTLTIPASAFAAADTPLAQGIHVVQPGETLDSIATSYGINLFELQVLNNNYHGWIYPGEELLLPVPGRESEAITPASETELAPEPTLDEQVHLVQIGESLGTIAETYGVSLYDLQAANGLWSWLIYAGQELVIPAGGLPPAVSLTLPVSGSETETVTPAPEPVAGEHVHVVQVGETLGTISDAYGVGLYDLQTVNDLRSWLIYPGQELAIPEGGTPPVIDESLPASEPVTQGPSPINRPDTHVVQRGETLFSIAQQYEVSLDALMAANGIADPRRIHSGLTLRVSNLDLFIPPPASSNDAPVSAPAPVSAGDREQYTVLPGEFLSQIGAKFGMSWLAIVEVNGIRNPDTINAGTVLQIPTAAEAAKYGPAFPVINHPGAHIGVGREVVVVLSTQTTYAYENGNLMKRAVISSGLPATPTVQGDFKVLRKVRSQNMTGPGYDLDNVEWVMYFHQSYALHGTWWHYNFGTPMSHGCVNMTNADAKWFYDFGSVGTPVHVRFY